MAKHDIIVIGASAGGVEALVNLIDGFPQGFPAAVFVVLHLGEDSISFLPEILDRRGKLPARSAEDGEPIQRGRIYVAPPNRHLLIDGETIHLSHGPKENGLRPSVNALFRTAAESHGPRVAAVVLSGTGDDGTAGLLEVKDHGGLAIVQDPQEALFPAMPRAAQRTVEVDATLAVAEIPSFLTNHVQLHREEPSEPSRRSTMDKKEKEIVEKDKQEQAQGERANAPAVLYCPDCGGALWEMQNGKLIQYRCHVGHVFSIDGLSSSQAEALESALWTAVRMLEERSILVRRQLTRARDEGLKAFVPILESRAKTAEDSSDTIRKLLLQANPPYDPAEMKGAPPQKG